MVLVSDLGWGTAQCALGVGLDWEGHTRRGDVCRRLAPRRSARQPRTRGHAADDAGEPLELAERPTAGEPRRYDSFCNVAATATGLVTVSKTGDSDRAVSRISCRVSSSASEATR
jgi:hypothetical protein